MAEFRMPSLGADMDAGTLVAFRVAVGDRVRRGQVLAEVETEKGIIEVEGFEDGVVTELLVPHGTKVPIGTPLASIAAEEPASAPIAPPPPGIPVPLASPAVRRRARDLDIDLTSVQGTGAHGRILPADLEPASPAPSPPSAAAVAPPPSIEPPLPVATAKTPRRIRVSPVARRRALALGLPLEGLAGSGPGGAIALRDVDEAARERPSAGPPTPATPAARMQQAIAAAMARANAEIPHYYLTHTVEIGQTMEWLAERNAEVGPRDRMVPGLLLFRAVAKALLRHSAFNGHFIDGEARSSEAVHVGMAISLRGGGLVAPALLDTDRGSLRELMGRFTDLVTRAKQGALRSTEMSAGTITVTSLGERSVEGVLPILFPPQLAMVGFGSILQRPWVIGDAIVARPVVTMTLAADHRATNGHQGARFLLEIERLLRTPEEL